jgi:hypothetical protein
MRTRGDALDRTSELGFAKMTRRPRPESFADHAGGPTIEQTVNDIATQTIDDIAAKTGSAPDNINLDVVRVQLHAQLLVCNELWGRYESARENYARTRKSAIDAQRAANVLLTSLRDEVLRREAEATGLLPPLETSPLEAFYKRIVSGELDIGAKEFMEDTKRLLGMWGRPLDTLVQWLMQTYEDVFKQEAKSSKPRKGGPPDTPFVRFAYRVTTALGIKCAPLSIHLAYERIRKRQRQHTIA